MMSNTVSISTRKRWRSAICTTLLIICLCRFAPNRSTSHFIPQHECSCHSRTQRGDGFVRLSRLFLYVASLHTARNSHFIPQRECSCHSRTQRGDGFVRLSRLFLYVASLHT